MKNPISNVRGLLPPFAFAAAILLVSAATSAIPANADLLPPQDVAINAIQQDAEERAFLVLINRYRAQYGAPALRLSSTLTRAAEWLSSDMASRNYFSHTDRLGRDFATRIQSFGFSGVYTMGENIAAGNASAQDTFTQWRNSPGHNTNMLNPSYRTIGIARVNDPSSTYRWYWTNDFGGNEK